VATWVACRSRPCLVISADFSLVVVGRVAELFWQNG